MAPAADYPAPEAEGVPPSEPPRWPGPTFAGRPLARWSTRALASIIDLPILGGSFWLLAAAVGLDVDELSEGSPYGVELRWIDLQALALSIIPTFAYSVVLLVHWEGSTLGKRLLGIRVVRADGRALGYRAAVLREVVAKPVLAIVWVVSILDSLWPLWDRENRALHDFPAGTRVVRRRAAA